MRDKIKDNNYFNEQLEYIYSSIARYEDLLSKVIDSHGDESEGAINGYGILSMFYTQALHSLYSAGKEIHEIKKVFNDFVKYYTLTWSVDNGYIDLIRTLSLGVLLNTEASEFDNLKEKIIDEGLDDYLVNYLLSYIDPSWEFSFTDFQFKDIYEPIKNIVEEDDKSISLNMLKAYLEKQWYGIHNECAWYNSHKSKQNTYYGYWAYEAGAIAKILQLNDEGLRGQQYYPYDLVHSKRGKK